MNLINEIKSGTFIESSTKPIGVFKEIGGIIRPLHEKNVTHGSEFIDDAIRTKDQPFTNSESGEYESSLKYRNHYNQVTN